MAQQLPHEIQSMIDVFERDWEIDVQRKLIQRTNKSGLTLVLEFFKRPQYPMKLIYRGVMNWHGSSQGMTENDIIDRDRMDVEGFPEKFALKGGWQIKPSDLKFVTHGPLVYEGSNSVVVPEKPRLERVAAFADKWKNLILLILGIIGIVVVNTLKLLLIF